MTNKARGMLTKRTKKRRGRNPNYATELNSGRIDALTNISWDLSRTKREERWKRNTKNDERSVRESQTGLRLKEEPRT